MSRYLRYLVPLAIFLVLAGFLFRGLSLDPKLVPSPLVGKPMPAFSLPRLQDPAATLSDADIRGQVSILNIWATWCVSCRAEHEVLLLLAQRNKANIYGLNYKDERPAAQRWLQQLGDPYAANAFDADGRVGIDWGVYGVPETFVIGADGMIKYKHIGPVTHESLEQKILPILKELMS
jgi:cytochrome c biogenesis protein CcmG/thiol:disulfide interchange protein DsbE